MTNREFRKIPSLDFMYEISEDGRIFRNVKSKKQLKIIVDYHHSPKGYCFTFVNIKGAVMRVPIARVVAECWLGPKPEGYQIDHIDRDSLNNHYSNLRYVTISEQMRNRDHSNISRTGSLNLALAREARKVPVMLSRGGESDVYSSCTDAARAISAMTSHPVERIRSKMKMRRSHIYGFDVKYL